MITALSLALQGFLLTPIAMAVQGLLGGDAVDPPILAPSFRPGVVSSGGPGATLNLSDYLKKFTLQASPPARAPSPSPAVMAQRAARRRQRMEEEILQLCAVD